MGCGTIICSYTDLTSTDSQPIQQKVCFYFQKWNDRNRFSYRACSKIEYICAWFMVSEPTLRTRTENVDCTQYVNVVSCIQDTRLKVQVFHSFDDG